MVELFPKNLTNLGPRFDDQNIFARGVKLFPDFLNFQIHGNGSGVWRKSVSQGNQ